jgi:ribosomal protein S18 acetylase RimI-like enzyme
MPNHSITQSPNHQLNQSPIHQLADKLEYHEESSNAQIACHVGGELVQRNDVWFIHSHPELGPGLNFACHIRSDRDIEKLVDEANAWFERHHIAPHFRVSPLTRPANLDQILEQRGFTCTEKETQMVLAGGDTEPPTNSRVNIETIQAHELECWVEIQSRGFGFHPSPMSFTMARATFEHSGNTLYIARLAGEPVAASVLVEWAGVQGIYGVATLPNARGQGIATALMRRMICDARARSDAPVCLQAETASGTQRWYERLGFRVVYDRTGWTLSPSQK